MNLLDIKTSVATYFNKELSELTLNGQDLFLIAVNNVRRWAEMNNDFEHSRRLLRLTVDGVTGGSLDDAEEDGVGAESLTVTGSLSPDVTGVYTKQNGRVNGYPWYTKIESTQATSHIIFHDGDRWLLVVWGDFPDLDLNGGIFSRTTGSSPVGTLVGSLGYTGTATVVVNTDWRGIKQIIEVGIFDEDDNLRPVNWTTVSESLERQRKDNPYTAPRYPTDGWHQSGPMGLGRFEFRGDNVFRFPKDDSANGEFELGIEVYTFHSDWTADDLLVDTDSNIWTEEAGQFLIWGVVMELNHRFKEFVFRQEGNLPPPKELRDEALVAFMEFDAHKFERNRRHGR